MAAQGPSESAIPLLQLPHFDQDLLRPLARKQVRALPDLYAMLPSQRREVYRFAGQPHSIPRAAPGCSASNTEIFFSLSLTRPSYCQGC